MSLCYLLQVELQGMTEDPDALTDKGDLCHMFPDIDTDMLQAVLTANGNSLEKAIENINAQMQCSLGKRPQTVSSPEALVKRGRYLLHQASEEQLKMDQLNRVRFVYTSCVFFRFPLYIAFRFL
jgi:hypothetical protein